MTALLALALIVGPPAPNDATLKFHLHLGRDRQSKQAAAELACDNEWFVSKRMRIERHYRLIVDGDALDHPTYQIGTGDERHRFRAGTFAASGTFLLALESLTAIDYWERQDFERHYRHDHSTAEFTTYRDESDRPPLFPPEIEP